MEVVYIVTVEDLDESFYPPEAVTRIIGVYRSRESADEAIEERRRQGNGAGTPVIPLFLVKYNVESFPVLN